MYILTGFCSLQYWYIKMHLYSASVHFNFEYQLWSTKLVLQLQEQLNQQLQTNPYISLSCVIAEIKDQARQRTLRHGHLLQECPLQWI